MSKKQPHGFTLIELLVVVGIVGLIAALILISLSNARDKAKDARVKSDLRQIQILTKTYEVYRTGYMGLGMGSCITGRPAPWCSGIQTQDFLTLVEDLYNQGGLFYICGTSRSFCGYSTLPSDSSKYICVDDTGVMMENAACNQVCGGVCEPLDQPSSWQGNPNPIPIPCTTPATSALPTESPVSNPCYFPTLPPTAPP